MHTKAKLNLYKLLSLFYTIIIIGFLINPEKIFSQHFLEVKYSVNDIKKQRELLKLNKIKSVNLKDNFSEKTYNVDVEGKIINKDTKGEFSFAEDYNYENNNLISIYAPLDADKYFKYDLNGNVIQFYDAAYTNNFIYDINNKLLKIESVMQSEEGEGMAGPELIKYNDDLIVEEIYSVSMGFYDRVLYEYDENKNLVKVTTYESQSPDNLGTVRKKMEYYYDENSNLPYKMIVEEKNLNYGKEVTNTVVTIFTYEYYK